MTDSGLILVVDDNEMNRDVMQRRLERQGYGVVTAENGARALELMTQHTFDLLLLDIMMPDVNGYEVLQRIKADPIWMHIPVIVISAVDHLESVVKCVEMGADDYLFKPFNPILLKARIGSCLDKKRLRDQEQQLLAAAVHLPTFAMGRWTTPSDIVDQFTNLAALTLAVEGLAELPASENLSSVVSDLFSTLDVLVKHYGLYRLRVSGNMMVLVGGHPFQAENNEIQVGAAVLEMAQVAAGRALRVRAGLDVGRAVGGVVRIGENVYYDVWGDPVTNAGNLQQAARDGVMLLSQAAYALLAERYPISGYEGYPGVYAMALLP